MALTAMRDAQVEQIRKFNPKLLTSRTKNCIRKGFKLGEWICCHPYVWNDVTGFPEYTTSRLQIMGWISNIIFAVGHWMFLVVQCVRVNRSPDEEMSTKALIIFAVILFYFPVCFHVLILGTGEELTSYVRSYFKYCQQFEENYVRESARPSGTAKIAGIIFTYLYHALPVDAVLFTMYSVTRLDSPEQVSSMIPAGNPLVQIVFCIVFCVYCCTCYAANAFALIFSAFGFSFAAFNILNEIGKAKSSFTTEDFQHPQDCLRSYRVIQLLTETTDRIYWVLNPAAQYVLMMLTMFCTYGAIRLDGLVGTVLGLLGATTAIILVVFLSAWAEFYSGAVNAVESLHTMTTRADVLEDKKLRVWLRRSAKSLQVARLSVCGAYHIDKELVLNAVGIISDGIFFLLVNF